MQVVPVCGVTSLPRPGGPGKIWDTPFDARWDPLATPICNLSLSLVARGMHHQLDVSDAFII